MVVEGRRPYCLSYGAVGHIAEACPGKNAAPRPRQAATDEEAVVFGEFPEGEWKRLGKKGRKKSRRSHSNHNPRSGWTRKSNSILCLGLQKGSNKKKWSGDNRNTNSSLRHPPKKQGTRPTTTVASKETTTEATITEDSTAETTESIA